MQQILVPTDLSTCAYDALRVAVDICRKKNDMVLHLLHTYEERHIAEGYGTEHERRKAVAQYRKKVFDKVHALGQEEFLKGIKVETHLIPGKKVWQVLRSSVFNDIDLIVMGTHGLQENKKWFMGSNTQKVVHFSEVPVLVVKEYLNIDNIDELIYSSSYEVGFTEGSKKMNDLIRTFNVKVQLLKIITPSHFESTDQSELHMKDLADKMGLERFETNIINALNLEEGLNTFANDHPGALIAIETQGVIGPGQFFFSGSAGLSLA